MITVGETQVFRRNAQKLLSTEEVEALVNFLAANPRAGDLIQGTGGIRKLRWFRTGMGKRGGTRVIYFYYNDGIPLYLMTIYGKGEKNNLCKEERNQLAEFARSFVDYWRKRQE